MPRFLASDAPTWDGRGRSLLTYIWQLERLLEMCKITDQADKLKWLVTYIDRDTREIWVQFDEYLIRDYNGMISRLKREYPDAHEAERGSLKRLKIICKEFRNIEQAEQDRFLEYKRAFKLESDKLLKPPAAVTNRELVEFFCSALHRDFQISLDTRLSLVGKTRNVAGGILRNEDPYDLDEVLKRAEELTSPKTLMRSYNRESSSSSGVATTSQVKAESSGKVAQEIASLQENVAVLKDMFGVQEKNMKSWMESLVQSINNPTTSSYRATTAQSQERTRDCRYCGEVGHFLSECQKKDKDIASGRVKWDSQKRYLLFGDGATIPQLDIPIIQRVDRHYQTKSVNYLGPTLQEPGLIDLASTQSTSQDSPVVFSQYVNARRDTRDEAIDRAVFRLKTQDDELQDKNRLIEMYRTASSQGSSAVATPRAEPEDPIKNLTTQVSLLTEQFGKILSAKASESSSGQQGF